MNLPFGLPITITSRTRSGTDAYGNPEWTETSTTVTGAFAPSAGSESTNHQDQVVNQPQAFLPYGTAVDSTSKLTINGTSYEVDGDPEHWSSPFTGWQGGIRVPLRLVTG